MTEDSALKNASDQELRALREKIDREMESRNSAPRVSPSATGATNSRLQTYTDGASRGNPGKAGVGALICDEKGNTVREASAFIGICTNNEAEYRALILALDLTLEMKAESVDCYMDSQLVVRQMTGQYAVKAEKMIQFWKQARERAAKFKKITFNHVPREHPLQQVADKLANRGIDDARR